MAIHFDEPEGGAEVDPVALAALATHEAETLGVHGVDDMDLLVRRAQSTPSQLGAGRWYSVGNSGSLIQPGNGRVQLIPWSLPPEQDVDGFAFNINTTAGEAGSQIKGLIYADDDGYPGELLLDTGPLSAASVGDKEFPDVDWTFLTGGRVWVGGAVYLAPVTRPQVRASTAVMNAMMAVVGHTDTSVLANGFTGYSALAIDITTGVPMDPFPAGQVPVTTGLMKAALRGA